MRDMLTAAGLRLRMPQALAEYLGLGLAEEELPVLELAMYPGGALHVRATMADRDGQNAAGVELVVPPPATVTPDRARSLLWNAEYQAALHRMQTRALAAGAGLAAEEPSSPPHEPPTEEVPAEEASTKRATLRLVQGPPRDDGEPPPRGPARNPPPGRGGGSAA